MTVLADDITKGLGNGHYHSGCHGSGNPLWFHCASMAENTQFLKGFGTASKSLCYGTICPGGAVISGEPCEEELDPKDPGSSTPRTPSLEDDLGDSQDSADAPLMDGPDEYYQCMVDGQNYGSFRDWSVIDHADCRDEDARSDLETEVARKSPYLGGLSAGRFWLIYSGILVNLFICFFDVGILSSSHPIITSHFSSSNSAAWLSTAFILCATVVQPLFGRLSDGVGRKLPYVISLSTLLLATIWCALAQSMKELIIARAVCGFGAGGTSVMGSIIINDLVPIETRSIYQSYATVLFGLGSAVGAATGGAIADALGWRWEFGIQVPVVVISLYVTAVIIPGNLGLTGNQQGFVNVMKKFDYRGSLLLTTSIASLILGLSLGGNVYAWSHWLVVSSLTVFFISFSLFVWNESVASLPIMPLEMICKTPYANLIMSNFLSAMVTNAVIFNLPLYFQTVLLKNATNSGLQLALPSVCTIIAALTAGSLITRWQRLQWPLYAGSLLILTSAACLPAMHTGMPNWQYMVILAPTGLGVGFLLPATLTALLSISEQSDQAIVTSTLVLWRSLGAILGISLSSLIIQNMLVSFLNRLVSGPEKQRVIQEIRQSAHAVSGLSPEHRAQVISAYAASFRVAFVIIAALALVPVILVVTVRLPRLGKKLKA